MQILRPHPRPTEAETLRTGPRNLHVNKPFPGGGMGVLTCTQLQNRWDDLSTRLGRELPAGRGCVSVSGSQSLAHRGHEDRETAS